MTPAEARPNDPLDRALADSTDARLSQIGKLPAGFAEAVSRRMLRERRLRRLVRLGASLVLIVGLVAAGAVAFVPREVPVTSVSARKVPKLSESFSETTKSISAATHETGDRAASPTKTLFAALGSWRPPTVKPTKLTVPDVGGLPSAARQGLQPIADGPRQTIRSFLRDSGLGSD